MCATSSATECRSSRIHPCSCAQMLERSCVVGNACSMACLRAATWLMRRCAMMRLGDREKKEKTEIESSAAKCKKRRERGAIEISPHSHHGHCDRDTGQRIVHSDAHRLPHPVPCCKSSPSPAMSSVRCCAMRGPRSCISTTLSLSGARLRPCLLALRRAWRQWRAPAPPCLRWRSSRAGHC